MNRIRNAFGILGYPRETTFITGTAGFLVGSAVIGLKSPRAILSEGEKPTKLSIYDDPKPDIVLVESPSRLEQSIRQSRIRIAQSHRIRDIKDKWIEVEQNTERTVKEVIAPDERVKPEILYIAVAGLAGTIVARNPSYYFIPQTTRNIAVKIREYEGRSPELTKAHESISNLVKGSKSKINSTIGGLKGGQSEEKK
ncbi:5728_t:CDS:2 [Acaulospora colombiana]|uniref:5728_t:CDS:1 n=1 Tax=Acaulospora colombiana TaxID=27376 RepID=A0ACA9L4U7_9GLOM|nr:5728_t:CDS:2 [Acaulospora colombiana]